MNLIATLNWTLHILTKLLIIFCKGYSSESLVIVLYMANIRGTGRELPYKTAGVSGVSYVLGGKICRLEVRLVCWNLKWPVLEISLYLLRYWAQKYDQSYLTVNWFLVLFLLWLINNRMYIQSGWRSFWLNRLDPLQLHGQ